MQAQTPFTAGNIVVVRIGDGAAPSSSVTVPMYLDEYTPGGTLVQSIPLPATASGSNFSISSIYYLGRTSFLSLSADNRYLTIIGFGANAGTSNSGGIWNNSTVNRTIARIDYNGSVNSSTTVPYTDVSGREPRGVISDNGTRFWSVSEYKPVLYSVLGQSTTTLIAPASSITNFNIANGQLYCTNTDKATKISGGLPITGPQTYTTLPGFVENYGATAQMFFADMNPLVPGFDVIYMADGEGDYALSKFSFNPGTNSWILNGTIGSWADNYRGITGIVNNGVVTLYCTRNIEDFTLSNPGEIVTLTDNTGYTLTPNSFNGTPVIFKTPPTNYAFRGIAMAPVKCKTPLLRTGVVTPTSAEVFITDSLDGGGPYEYQLSTNNTPPATGTPTNSNIISSTTLNPGIHYYVHVRRNCGGGDYSSWATIDFITNWPPCVAPIIQNPVFSTNNSITATWQSVFTAVRYEYALSLSATPPASGTSTTLTTATISNLASATPYYLHVRAFCGGGDTSAWATRTLTTPCFGVSPYLIKNDITTGTAEVGWHKINGTIRYEHAILPTAASPNGSMVFTADTVLHVTGLRGGGKHYLHIRAYCGPGSSSPWSILEFNTSGVEVYPNPATNQVTISVFGQGANAGKSVKIFDSNGVLIKEVRLTNNTVTVDVQKWAGGVYFVRYGNEKGYFTRLLKL